MLNNDTLAPEVRSVVFESSLDSSEASLHEVTSSSGRSLSFGVDIVNTSEVEQLLGDGRSNQTSSSRSRDQSNLN